MSSFKIYNDCPCDQSQESSSTPGPTGPTGPSITGSRGLTGPSGISPQNSITGPTGTIGFQSNALTGPTGASSIAIGNTGPPGIPITGPFNIGPTGPETLLLSEIGPQGPTGRCCVDKTGPTGPTAGLAGTGHTGPDSNTITGPPGPPGTGGGGESLVALFNIDSQIIPNNTRTILQGTQTFNNSEFYIIWNPTGSSGVVGDQGATIGLPPGFWKIVVDVEWAGSGTLNTLREIEILDGANTQTYPNNLYAQNSTVNSYSGTISQQLTWCGSTFLPIFKPPPFPVPCPPPPLEVLGSTFKFQAFNENIGGLTIQKGTIAVYSYTQAVPTDHIDGLDVCVPDPREFVLRFINHDLAHPPVQIAIIHQNIAATQGLYVDPGPTGVSGFYDCRPINQQAVISPSGPVPALFLFDWEKIQPYMGNPNIRELILGGTGQVLNSTRIWIAKTDIRNNPVLFPLWNSNSLGLVSGVPEPYVEGYPANILTVDKVELTYNNPLDIYTFFANTTQVDSLDIPMTLTINHKVINGNKKINTGPCGSTMSMQSILDDFANQATGSVWFNCLKPVTGALGPTGPPARIVAPQKLDGPTGPTGPWFNYYNSYVESAFTGIKNNPVTFTSRGDATFATCTISMTGVGDSLLHVVTNDGCPPNFPVSVKFDIPVNEIIDYTLDIFGNSGVWATGTGLNQVPASGPGVEDTVKKAKAYIVATMCRGVVELQDTFTGGTTSGYPNSVWNDWLDKGANFFQNTPVDLYCRVIHNISLNGEIDYGILPYAYALSFDDIYNWSTTMKTQQVGSISPAPDTEIQIMNIDIYENDNIP